MLSVRSIGCQSVLISDSSSFNSYAGPPGHELNDLEVAQFTAVDGETDKGPDLVPSLQARGTGVDVQAT